jgi:hypothetical protein
MKGKASIMLFVAIAAMIVTACGSKEITVNGPNGEKTTIKSDNNTTTIKSNEGETTIQSNSDGSKTTWESKDKDGNVSKMELSDNSKIPDGFPSDIPIPSNAKITSSITTNSNGKTVYLVTYEIKQTFDALKKTYKDYMNNGSYQNVNEMSTDNEFFMISGKRNGETDLAVTVTTGDGVLQVGVQYSMPQK